LGLVTVYRKKVKELIPVSFLVKLWLIFHIFLAPTGEDGELEKRSREKKGKGKIGVVLKNNIELKLSTILHL